MFTCRVHISVSFTRAHPPSSMKLQLFPGLSPRHTHQALIEASSKSPMCRVVSGSGWTYDLASGRYLLDQDYRPWNPLEPIGTHWNPLEAIGSHCSYQTSTIGFWTPTTAPAPGHGPQGCRKVHVSQRLIELMAEGQRLQPLGQYRLAGNESKDENGAQHGELI